MPRQLPATVRATLDTQHGVITRQQLLSLGCSDRNLATWVRRGGMVRISPGCLAAAETWSAANPVQRHLMQLLCVHLTAPDTIARDATSALSWRLPVRAIPDLPRVIRESDRATLTSAWVQRRAVDPGHVRVCGSLTTLDLAHTVVDVASTHTLPDALITVDAALRRGLALTDLWTAVGARGAFAGVDRARTAIAAGDPAAESPLESLSRGRVIECRLPLPLCNVVIKHRGRSARVDKLWVEDGVVGEADGKRKYGKEDAQQVIWDEKRRHDWLSELGFDVRRWGMPEVGDDGTALERRYRRGVARQRAIGFRWPKDVTVEVPRLRDVQLPARVVTEVERLAQLGYPIRIVDAKRQFGGSPALWTPKAC